MKLASVSPVYKAKDPLYKINYRPVSVLLLLSKIYERLFFTSYLGMPAKVLRRLLSGFRKVHSTQHAVFRLLHSWKKALDNLEYIGTVLMDLLKVYDCIPHDLLN